MDSLLYKAIEKIIAKVSSIEDLIFLIICLSAGMLIHRKWLSSGEQLPSPSDPAKQLPASKTKTQEEIETYSSKDHKCANIDSMQRKIFQMNTDFLEMKFRLGKVMNVMSHEFEKKWDRYMYDPERSLDEDDVK